MSRQFHYFLATRLCFPALAHHFRRQICRCKIHSVPAVQMSHRPARVRDARLFIGQARHQSTRSFLIPINVLNGGKRLNGLNDLNGLRYFMAHGIAYLLDRMFQREKATAKPFNDAYFANLY
jgi:hypothetical protein